MPVVIALYLKAGARFLKRLLPWQYLPVKHKKFAMGGGAWLERIINFPKLTELKFILEESKLLLAFSLSDHRPKNIDF